MTAGREGTSAQLSWSVLELMVTCRLAGSFPSCAQQRSGLGKASSMADSGCSCLRRKRSRNPINDAPIGSRRHERRHRQGACAENARTTSPHSPVITAHCAAGNLSCPAKWKPRCSRPAGASLSQKTERGEQQAQHAQCLTRLLSASPLPSKKPYRNLVRPISGFSRVPMFEKEKLRWQLQSPVQSPLERTAGEAGQWQCQGMGRIKPSSSRCPGLPLHLAGGSRTLSASQPRPVKNWLWPDDKEARPGHRFNIDGASVRTCKASRRRVKQGLVQGDTAGEPARTILADAGIRMLPCTSKEAVTSWSGGGHV